LGEVCLEHDILIVSDEIYEKLIYGVAEYTSIAQLSNALKEQTLIINGVSKSHSMTGWRIGYAAGNKQLIKAMTNLASHSTSNPTSIAQYAAIEALTAAKDAPKMMRHQYKKRRDYVYNRLTQMGLTVEKPTGAFYLF
ncbi:aminotransferase class I/II-fold pyridoxal phosphate-dependent enzyme, partial [Escherichia coli]|nr:aminotransferase class I/II-fold pyridoxal phosphate-dependent enzyme [Escherichia coli]